MGRIKGIRKIDLSGLNAVDDGKGKVTLSLGSSSGTAISVTEGGTGATTVGDARTNLGVNPVAGSSSIVTTGTITTGTWEGTTVAINQGGTGSTATAYCSLASNVTGTLPVLKGGTGATSLADLITLNTHTTGNYVEGVSVGDGISNSYTVDGDKRTCNLNLTGDITIKAANDAAASILLEADNSDDPGDSWKVIANTDHSLTIGNDKDSAETHVAHLTITPHATAASSTIAAAGNLTVGTDLTTTGDLTVNGGDATLSSATTEKPIISITNTTDDATSGEIRFNNTRGGEDGAADDDLGRITFYGQNNDDAGGGATLANLKYGEILAESSTVADGSEGGKIKMLVASHDGGLEQGLLIEDGNLDAEVDVTLGNGAGSVTAASGSIQLGSGKILGADGSIAIYALNDDYIECKGYVKTAESVFIAKQAGAMADIANHGQLWTKSTTDIDLWYTNASGDDIEITNGDSLVSAVSPKWNFNQSGYGKNWNNTYWRWATYSHGEAITYSSSSVSLVLDYDKQMGVFTPTSSGTLTGIQIQIRQSGATDNMMVNVHKLAIDAASWASPNTRLATEMASRTCIIGSTTILYHYSGFTTTTAMTFLANQPLLISYKKVSTSGNSTPFFNVTLEGTYS